MGGGGGLSFEQQRWLMEQQRATAPPTPIDMRVILGRIARRKAAMARWGLGGTILTGKVPAATAKTSAPVPRVGQASAPGQRQRGRERTLISTQPVQRLGG